MTQEDKDLLLVDLCARLPYKPKIKWFIKDYNPKEDAEEVTHLSSLMLFWLNREDWKLYLRPMSSMTYEERFVYNGLRNEVADFDWEIISHKIYDWLNARHFDFRRLIEKGLALEAPKDMYKIK